MTPYPGGCPVGPISMSRSARRASSSICGVTAIGCVRSIRRRHPKFADADDTRVAWGRFV